MPAPLKRVLFIMCDQLRFDYLSCAGHPHIETPHIDALAARGVRFTNAYVQSPVCGASRMSFYTGRYVSSHGATWNGVPLKVGEKTLGDYTRALGVPAALVGKTHMKPDSEGMERLGITPESIIGVRVSECGFDPYERDDGLHGSGPDGLYAKPPRYNEYLRDKGFAGENPWHDWANAAENNDGSLASGWAMRHARKPARIPEEKSETPYMTRRAMDYIREQGDGRYVLHLSYIKPHWPYIAPAPYNDMYGAQHVVPAVRADTEKENPHPVYKAFMDLRVGRNFARDEVRKTVIPAYMGLIRQIDDQLGILFADMREKNLLDETLIIFTSDHGDYLGDHWLGEKDLFHDPSAKIPLIIVDPRPSADATRGTINPALVESIDIVPTILECLGDDAQSHDHVLEGRSLLPFLHGEKPAWRDAAISEYDYSVLPVGAALNRAPKDCRLFMAFDGRWKLIHAPGFRPMLFDLLNDPQELHDCGRDLSLPDHADAAKKLYNALHRWSLRQSQRTTLSEAQMLARRGKSVRRGILIGVYDESELPDELWAKYRGD